MYAVATYWRGLQAAQSKYIWLEELGRGRFGTTYLVQDKETGEHFAVKQISKTQPSFKRGRILTEVKVHATLKDHPNVAGGLTTTERSRQSGRLKGPAVVQHHVQSTSRGLARNKHVRMKGDLLVSDY